MCLAPGTIKASGVSRPMGGYSAHLVPCGKCPECLRRKRDQWAFRLQQQSKHSPNPRMITFTYREEPINQEGLQTLVKSDWQSFMKRLRKNGNYKGGLKYFVSGEYGSLSGRPHYHAIFYGLTHTHADNYEFLESTWKHGFCHIAPLNEATIYYTLKYITKGRSKFQDTRQPEFCLMSKGLGLDYLSRNMHDYYQATMKGYATLSGGIKAAMPRYYREKVYTPNQVKVIALQGLEMAKEKEIEKFNNEWEKYQWIKDQFRKHNTWKQNQKDGLKPNLTLTI